MFLAPNFFGGTTPRIFEVIYKIDPDFAHVAKFQRDRSRDLGESVAKKKKHQTSEAEYKPVRELTFRAA